MKRIILALGIAVLTLGGCGKPTPGEITALNNFLEDGLKHQLNLYFNKLNSEGHERRSMLRLQERMAENNPTLHRSEGLTYHSYLWNEEGFLVYDYECKTCKTRLLIHFSEPVAETYLCPSCRHSPYKTHRRTDDLKVAPCSSCVGAGTPKESVQTIKFFEESKRGRLGRMYEITKFPTQDDPAARLEVTVRYIRKSYTYDSLGILKVPSKAMENGAVNSLFVPTRGARMTMNTMTGRPEAQYNLQGFHRLDGTFAGEIKFVFTPGKLERARTKDEAMTILPIREEPFRPWKDIQQKNADFTGR